MYSIIEFDPFKADETLWEAYFYLYNELNPGQLKLSAFISSVQQQCRKKESGYRLIFKDGYGIEMAFYSYSKPAKDGNKILYIVFENIIKENSEDLLRNVAAGLIALMKSSKADSFVTLTDDPLVLAVLSRFQGQTINTINYYRLLKSHFDIRSFDGFEENTFFSNYGLSVQQYEYVPEPLYTSFSALMTELMNDIIRNDSREVFEETAEGIKNKTEKFKEANIRMLLFLLFDQSQVMIGLSFVLVYPDSTVAKQELTGVKKQYRGKKIASHLKAAVTAQTFRAYPHIDQMETNCYGSNLPIIRINQALGYSLADSKSQLLIQRDYIADMIESSQKVQ
jgi:RimJ/RimL family protein N-acetyltransferase